jgi:hypothetical protein
MTIITAYRTPEKIIGLHIHRHFEAEMNADEALILLDQLLGHLSRLAEKDGDIKLQLLTILAAQQDKVKK